MNNSCVIPIQSTIGNITLDTCTKTISYQLGTSLEKEILLYMSNHCFDIYKYRLGDVSDLAYIIGSLEYEEIHKALIDAVVDFKPKNLSFSINSVNPSLHFIIRMPEEISIFLETYINPDEDNRTYLQVLDDDEPILKTTGSFFSCLNELETTLENKFPFIERVYGMCN